MIWMKTKKHVFGETAQNASFGCHRYAKSLYSIFFVSYVSTYIYIIILYYTIYTLYIYTIYIILYIYYIIPWHPHFIPFFNANSHKANSHKSLTDRLIVWIWMVCWQSVPAKKNDWSHGILEYHGNLQIVKQMYQQISKQIIRDIPRSWILIFVMPNWIYHLVMTFTVRHGSHGPFIEIDGDYRT